MKKVIATILLGLFLIRHFIVLLWKKIIPNKTDSGYQKFMHNFRNDAIIPVSPKEAEVFSQMQSCIRCGICDSLCEGSSQLMGFSPSLLASTCSRSLPETKFCKKNIESFKECDACDKCYELCPTGIEIKHLVKQIQRFSNELT